MNVVQVVPRMHEEASGPAQSVRGLCLGLAALGEAVTLAVLEPAPAAVAGVTLDVYPAWPYPWRLGVSPVMRRGLCALAREADIVHSHSLWMAPNVYPGAAVRQGRASLVVSPRGALSPWALSRSPWVKRAFWQLFQGRVLREAACLHATAPSEYLQIRECGLFGPPICIIPNGVELPPPAGPRLPRGGGRTLLFLGRIHPIKGVDGLLRAWQAVEGRWPDWGLDIVGPLTDSYARDLQALAQSLGVRRVHFRGPAYGAAKLAIYRDAELFVLPTHSENFGVAVAEALAAGTPAIVTRAAPWAGLETQGAGWWIDTGLNPLVAALDQALAESPESLAARGVRGRGWMAADFSWAAVAKQMQQTYAWLRDGGKSPPWVRFD